MVVSVVCGVWCVAFLRKFLGFLNSQQITTFTFAPDFFMNTEVKSEQLLNSQRIWDLRRNLSLLSKKKVSIFSQK